MDSEGIGAFIFSLSFRLRYHELTRKHKPALRRAVAKKILSGGEDDVLGSTESLFAAWAHCARMSGARQLEWLCIPSENVQKFFDEEKFKEKRRIQRKKTPHAVALQKNKRNRRSM
jgi:hypothetical protein